MQDSFGRNINYMRISLTDRCNYACYYCKPDISKHLCHSDILTYEQLLDICRCAITLGITGAGFIYRREWINLSNTWYWWPSFSYVLLRLIRFCFFLPAAPPEKAYMYGLPYKYYEKYKIRRYGFHGTSHSFVSKKAAKVMEKPYEELKTIVCHLGNGSSRDSCHERTIC